MKLFFRTSRTATGKLIYPRIIKSFQCSAINEKKQLLDLSYSIIIMKEIKKEFLLDTLNK